MRICSLLYGIAALVWLSISAEARQVNFSNLDDALQMVKHTEHSGSLTETDWLEHARLGTLQLPGCTAALVSADGLAATSATCLRSLETWIRPGDTLFVADELSQEHRLAGLEVRQLLRIRKIDTPDDRDSQPEADIYVDIIASRDSSDFWEHTWRVHDDNRLVLISPVEIANFGQEDGVYPRHAMDFALFRVYDGDGHPLDTESYFAWSDRSPHPREKLFSTAFHQNEPFTHTMLSDTFEYNGTTAPPFTTLYGMLDLHYSHGKIGSWALSAEWRDRIGESDLSAPLNFSVAGECAQAGAAILNTDMEVLGIAFDDAYVQESVRCVAVSASGIFSLLATAFHASRIAEELADESLEGDDES